MLLEMQYTSETLFGPYKLGETDKIERRIITKCIDKKIILEGRWRILPNTEVFKLLTPVTIDFRRKRTSFLGHLIRTHESRSVHRLVFFWEKVRLNWIKEVKRM